MNINNLLKISKNNNNLNYDKNELLKKINYEISLLKLKNKNINYEDYKVSDTISFYYINNIINDNIAEILTIYIKNIYKDKNNLLPYSKRVVQNYGGIVKENSIENKQELPEFIENIFRDIIPDNIIDNINHCLINVYPTGTGIMAHKDGPRYFPCVIILSLNSHCFFNILSINDGIKTHLKTFFIEKNSLLIFKDDIYNKYYHEIEELKLDTLTIHISKHNNSLIKSNINNLTDTYFYQKYILENTIEEINNKLSKDKINFELNSGNNDEHIYLINLIRSERISMTLRYVN